MRILVFTSLFPNRAQPSHGIFIKERVRHFASNVEVKVVAPISVLQQWGVMKQIPRREEIDGMDVYHPHYIGFPKLAKFLDGWLMYRSVLSAVKGIQKEFDFDLLDVHYAYPDGFAGFLLSCALKRPYILSVRGSDIHLLKDYPARRRLIRKTLKNAAQVVAVSRALRDEVAELGAVPEKVTIIPNGVDQETFFPGDRQAAREKLGLSPHRTILLAVGRLMEVKGIQYLLPAVSEIKREGEYDKLQVFVVGEGPLRGALTKRIQGLGIETSVFLIGQRPHEELYSWFNAADLFCLPSLSEGCPNVLLEAMACGTPVVASKVGGVPDLVDSAEVGILTPPANPAALAEAIKCGLAHRWDRQTIAQRVRNRSWDKPAEEILEIFGKIVGQSKGAS